MSYVYNLEEWQLHAFDIFVIWNKSDEEKEVSNVHSPKQAHNILLSGEKSNHSAKMLLLYY